MKKTVLLSFLLLFTNVISAQNEFKIQVGFTLDSWHKAATEANFDSYFNLLTDDAIFIGTDATENWTKSEFESYAKPHFDKGKAWSFTAVERQIYFNSDNTIAWFDELLDTQMKICRGSGILVLQKGQWKIQHYVLSMTVPNDNVTEVVKIKAPIENSLLVRLKQKK